MLRLARTTDTFGVSHYETVDDSMHARQMLAKSNRQLALVEAGHRSVESHFIPGNGHFKLAEAGKMSRVQMLLDAVA